MSQPRVEERVEALRRNYATLCAQTGYDAREQKRIYATAYAKFPEFGGEPDFTGIGIDLGTSLLTVTTRMIELPYKALGIMVPIGEFAIRIKAMPCDKRAFRCYNRTGMVCISEPMAWKDNRYANHPHVYEEGTLCTSEENTINVAIADGELLRAARYILKSLKTLTYGVIAGANIEAWHHAHLKDELVPPYNGTED